VTFVEATERARREYLQALLRKHLWNITQASLEAGMDRSNFKRTCRRLGVSWSNPHDPVTPNMPQGEA
jgi:transcriptional regulator of acetoin/glycerol metabolism